MPHGGGRQQASLKPSRTLVPMQATVSTTEYLTEGPSSIMRFSIIPVFAAVGAAFLRTERQTYCLNPQPGAPCNPSDEAACCSNSNTMFWCQDTCTSLISCTGDGTWQTQTCGGGCLWDSPAFQCWDGSTSDGQEPHWCCLT